MGKIILLNGPPSSGKDTAAKHIRSWYAKEHSFNPDSRDWSTMNKCQLDRMSMPIKRAFAATMSLPIDEDGNVAPWESQKEVPIPDFGISYRQWQIAFSESFLKKYNSAIFPVLLARRIERRFSRGIANLMVIPDCGFQIEVDVLYQIFNHKDILLVRCHRNGYGFQQDSRSYVRGTQGTTFFDAINDHTIEHYLQQIETGVRCWLETPERMPREE